MPSVVAVLEQLGGVATLAELTQATSAKQVRRALREVSVVRDRRGRYLSAATERQLRIAHEISAVLSHESAALHHGWQVKTAPEQPVVTVRRKRHLSAGDLARCTPHWRDLPDGSVHRGVTTQHQTALDCARDLPFDRALAVVDSALRAESLSQSRLRSAAAKLRGRGAAKARRVAAEACLLAANPMESVLRAIVLDIPGFCFTPQLQIWEHGLYATVDLGDQPLMVAIEAEGFAFHSGRREFRRDCRRYDELVAWGWTVFRFSWEQIMFEPEFVRWCLVSWRDTRRGAQVGPAPAPPARLR